MDLAVVEDNGVAAMLATTCDEFHARDDRSSFHSNSERWSHTAEAVDPAHVLPRAPARGADLSYLMPEAHCWLGAG